jgi:hypothetical protein
VSNKDSGFAEHLMKPAMSKCASGASIWYRISFTLSKDFYVISESNKGRVNRTDLEFYECRKYLKQKDDFEEYRPLVRV